MFRADCCVGRGLATPTFSLRCSIDRMFENYIGVCLRNILVLVEQVEDGLRREDELGNRVWRHQVSSEQPIK